MKSSNISITLSLRPLGYVNSAIKTIAERFFLILILSFLFLVSVKAQDCENGLTPLTVSDTGTDYVYESSSIDMQSEVIYKFKVTIYENTTNTIQLRKSVGSEPYNLNIFACGESIPIHTVTANFNAEYTIPNSILTYGNCSGEFLFEAFHVQSSTYSTTATITTRKEDCPSTATINFSDPTANTSGVICADDPTLLVSLDDMQNSAGNLITDNLCIIGGGTFYLLDGLGVTTDTLNLNTTGEAELNPANLEEGSYTLKFSYFCSNDVDSLSVQKSFYVYEQPNATFTQDLVVDTCRNRGVPIYLTNFLDPASDISGTFRVLPPAHDPTDTVTIGSGFYPGNPGLFDIEYTVPNLGSCSYTESKDTISFLIGFTPEFQLQKPPFQNCQGGQFSINIALPPGVDTMGNRFTWTSSQFHNQTYCPGDIPQGFSATFSNPDPGSSDYVTICLEVADVSSCNAQSDSCPAQECVTFYVYNDTNNCNCIGPNHEVCYATGQDQFFLGCLYVNISLGTIVGTDIIASDTIIDCSDDYVVIDEINSNFFGFTVPSQENQTKIKELGLAAPFCNFFGIELDYGIGKWKPFDQVYQHFGCDETVSSYLFKTLTAAAQGSINSAEINGGAQTYIVADTDGDGAFDYAVNPDYVPFPLTLYNAQIPNNVDGNGRVITVRVVAGFPLAPRSYCGSLVATGKTILEILPIEAIPIIGDALNEALEAADCDKELSFVGFEDQQIFVVNENTPQFITCPETTIQILEDFTCGSGAVWPLPLAKDACGGDILPYDANADSAFVANNPSFVGVFHNSGYNLGEPIPQGTHTIQYKAQACNGELATCEFYVEVGPGDPLLEVTNDIEYPMDYGYSTAIVTGLAPLSGIGCSTTITYDVYPEGQSIPIFSGFNDASGHAFPAGENKIVYTMDFTNSSGTAITKRDSFYLDIIDNVKPVPLCGSLEITLDNNGSATIMAEDLDGGSFDNASTSNDLTYLVEDNGSFVSQFSIDCEDKGWNYRTLKIIDEAFNESTCIADLDVKDFFTDFQITMDLPELCFEALNPEQLNFSNYLAITTPNSSTSINHSQVGSLGNNIKGDFNISNFVPNPGVVTSGIVGTSPQTPGETGYIDRNTGQYYPGSSSGYVTITYLLHNTSSIDVNDDGFLSGCFTYVHETFELRQPLELTPPTCACGDFTQRFVDLGTVTGGLEPYTIQYSGGKLDINSDGLGDDIDGEYMYTEDNGHNIYSFDEDLGQLLMEYTNSDWSITIVDARGCEVFRAGSCDNIDVTSDPVISCPDDIGVVFTDEGLCSSLQEWTHPDIFSGQLADNCVVTEYLFYIKNADGSLTGPNDLTPLLNIDPDGNLDVDSLLFNASHHFPQGVSTVNYYAADATGNFIECSFTVTVEDNRPPIFYNCPVPPIVENTETNHCDAYVNFALPIAEDNCDIPTVVQIDNTGLTTGDRFPAGTTIMYWEASDESGNRDTCQVKVIVNDYENIPDIVCVDDVISTTEDWSCEAQIYNLNPAIDGICLDNFSVVYEIFSDQSYTNRIGYGTWDASGEYFEKGDSWVKYTIESQPLLLISEISQSETTDQIELVNLGPAAIDISCLEINRTAADGAFSESLPMVSMLPSLDGTIIGVGEVLVFDFTTDAPADMGACYVIKYMDNLIDQVSVNNYAGSCEGFEGALNGGNVYRIAEADSDSADDWAVEENCYLLTIGDLNDDLDPMPDNGTTTSLQSISPSQNTCVIKVTILDDEDPFCGELDSANTYYGFGLNNINNAQCNRSTLAIPQNCIIGQMTLNMTGSATPANSTITLISPQGFEYPITELPYDLFDDVYTLKSQGIWTIDIEPNTAGSFNMTAWNLEMTCMDPFTMNDASIPSEPGICGAQFDWTHPWFVDNCIEGSISVTYTSDDAECVPDSGTLTDFGGDAASEFFCVGTTTVTYTLVDEAGNDHECSFDVTVNDIEDPVVTCPADISIELEGGACDIEVCFEPLLASDNCAVVDTTYSQDPCTPFEIGVNVVTITLLDEAGNSTSCNFDIEIIEYVPANYNMVCNDLVNIALDAQCEEDITADMVLEGNGYHCYEDYEITVTDLNGFVTPNSPTIDIQDVGENFLVMVYDPDSGNSCWSEISIQDHANPILDCPDDVTVTCLQSTAYGATGQAILTSCEASVDWLVDDEFETYDSCDEIQSVITRVITVVDESGNASNCVQTITVERILVEDVTFPPFRDGVSGPVVSCASANSNPNATSPAFTGRPKVGFVNLDLGPTCGISVNMSDEVFDLCDGSYDILRTWSVYDGCLPPEPGVNPITYTQLIKVVDNVKPGISCPPNDTVSVDYLIGCNIDYQIPPASVSDACSDYEVITTGPFGSIYGNGGTLQGLPQGTFEIKFQAIDDCNNKSFCEYDLTVVDSVSPAMICIQQKEVVLNSGGYAEVQYEAFDLFSFDNCCLESIDVKRGNSAYGESVSFDCNDDIVIVTLRGIDCYGNINTCISEVNVEDKTGPQIDCPADLTIDCDIYYSDFAANLDNASGSGLPDIEAYAFLDADFGATQVTDNCSSSLDMTMEYGVNQCGEGAIIRTWSSIDPSGNEAISCSQTITIQHQSDWTINFPEDWSGELASDCTIPDINYGDATVDGDNCEMIAISYADEPYLVSALGCYKIVRTWTAINWCTYDGALSQDNSTVISASDNIYNVTGSDFISHVQTLDIYDTAAPTIEDIGVLTYDITEGCDTDIELPAPTILDECTETDYSIVSQDLLPYGAGTSYSNVPEGSYVITYGVSDACGNISFLTTTVEVSDAKKPTPYCVDQLVVEIMPDGNGDGMAMINAADFDAGSFDNCTELGDLVLSLSNDITQSTQEFDCSHVGIQTIELHVWDEAGNVDFCSVSLDIQDNNSVCATPTLAVSGTLSTEMNEAIESATVQINGGLFTAQSALDGSFIFDQLPQGGDYSIVPGLDLDPDNGVTTFDIVLITRHILGIELLNSPYKLIAADANNSGSISTLDVVNIRKVILGIDLNFPNNTSWRFIDESYDFPNPTNPWAPGFPEVINLNNLDQDTEASFIGIKVGDVNGSAQSHSLIPVEELDGDHPFIIRTDNQKLSKGQKYSVLLKADQATLGFQFTLNFDNEKLRFVDIESGLMNEEHTGLSHLSYGAITCSWNDNVEQLLEDDDLISFEFEALEDGLLSDMISINSRITKAEAYSSIYPLQEISLMVGDALANNIELYQNVPNPFKGQTKISFYLPEDAMATLTIRDLNGKVVANYDSEFTKGNNTLIVKDIPKGVFYYTLNVDRYIITRKMVKL
jgi:hypothetical protein